MTDVCGDDWGNFYFVVFPRGDRSKVTVVDLSDAVGYQRSDWAAVDDTNYVNSVVAIKAARKVAKVLGAEYIPFESRYDSSLNEVEDV